MIHHTQQNSTYQRPTRTPLSCIGLFLPAGLWYALIFWFSSRTADASEGQSGALLQLLGIVSPAFRTAEEKFCLAASEIFSFPIRKCAHMFLFFVLALLLLYALARLMPRGWQLVLPLCALLAALDEYHQTFVPGRSGEVRDVLVDLSGSAIALLLLAAVSWRRRKQSAAAFASLAVPTALALAAVLIGESAAKPALSFLAEQYVTDFSGMEGAEKASLLAGLIPILRDALMAAAWGLLGACAWLAAQLTGLRSALVWESLPASAVLAALLSGLAGAVPPLTAAGLAVLGGVLTAVLWLVVSFAAFPRQRG